MIQKRYIKKLDMEIAPLGEGVMRFHLNGAEDIKNASRFFCVAMDKGINYYDTAYFYLDSKSEELIRNALVERYPRESFIIADKLPVWLCNKREDMENIFNEQLRRLGTDYIDIYLMHGLDLSRWQNVYESGVLDFLEEKKREGRIRKTGFSFHDKAVNIHSIADAYSWDIVQLQINYYDWIVQDVKHAYKYVCGKDIPVVVMEPVGGGRLAKLPGSIESRLKTLNSGASIASWAVRFCASLPGVAVVLSGMTTQVELEDNTSCFSPDAALSANEFAFLKKVALEIQKTGAIPCSACRYCVNCCPVGIDIPLILQQYNDYKIFDRPLSWSYLEIIPPANRGDRCINCRKCIDNCPQSINIPEQLRMVHELAESIAIKPVLQDVFGKDTEPDTVFSSLAGKHIVLFGAGQYGKSMLAYMKKRDVKAGYFCDNSSHLWGMEIDGIEVISPEQLKELYDDNGIQVIITSKNAYSAIKKQLGAMGIASVN